MKLIIVRFLKEKATRKNRYKATCNNLGPVRMSVTINEDEEIGWGDNVVKAAQALVDKVYVTDSDRRYKPKVVEEIAELPNTWDVAVRLDFS